MDFWQQAQLKFRFSLINVNIENVLDSYRSIHFYLYDKSKILWVGVNLVYVFKLNILLVQV